MAHPKEVDDFVTSIEVDEFAYPGVETPKPETSAERSIQRPDPTHCPSCGQFHGSPAHGHKPKE